MTSNLVMIKANPDLFEIHHDAAESHPLELKLSVASDLDKSVSRHSNCCTKVSHIGVAFLSPD
jgi:hypothetical protein